MKEKIAFIVESTKLAHRTFIHLSENHKDKEIYIISMKVIGLYEFSYPRDLKFTDFPYLSNPKWQESNLANPVVFKVHDDSLESTRDPFSSVLREAMEKSLKKGSFFWV